MREAATYIEVDSGHCEDTTGYGIITSTVDCNAASEELGYGISFAIEISDPSYSAGCIVYDGTTLLVNSDLAADFRCSADDPCLCAYGILTF